MRSKVKKNNRKEAEKKLIARISKIEGQARGVKKMIEEKKECFDILIQINAMRGALGKIGAMILKDELICQKKKIDEKYLEKIFKIN